MLQFTAPTITSLCSELRFINNTWVVGVQTVVYSAQRTLGSGGVSMQTCKTLKPGDDLCFRLQGKAKATFSMI